jgi:hypothetical protein
MEGSWEEFMKEQKVIASILIFLGLYSVGASLSMSVWHRSIPEEGFFPFVLGCILVVLSIILLFQNQEKKGSTQAKARTNRGKVIFYVIAILFYALTFDLLGFPLSTAISLTTILKWIERQSWRTALGVSIGSSFFCYFLFVYFLNITLPLGPLNRWDFLFWG